MKKLMVLVMAVCLASCVAVENKSPVSVTYSTFKTFEVAYVQVLGVAADLHKQGKISDSDKADIIDLGKKFKLAYQGAAIAFETWVESPSFANEKQMNKLLENTEFLMAEFRRWIYERQ